MAADAFFTQISNALFRDPRISFKAKGVFGLISTHRDGFGVSAESIAAAGKDGTSAVKGALRELEEYGYLRRTQARREDGTMGPVQYYITDMPAEERPRSAPVDENRPPAATSGDAQNRRSEPVVGNPPAVYPPAENHPHKNNNSSSRKKISGEKTLSPPPIPEQRTTEPEPAPAGERETIAASQDKPTTAQRVIRAAGVVTAEEEAAFIAWATATHQPRGGAWWRTVTANGDLPDLAAAWRAERQPATGPAGRTIPPWCGQCDGEPIAERWQEGDDGRVRQCPRCHPDAIPTHADRRGHTPYRNPIDQSAYDRGFDGRPLPVSRAQQETDAWTERAMARAQARMDGGRPLPGTDTTVAGWAAVARQLDGDGGGA